MPIVFVCPESSLECIYEKEYAGKTFKCMHCDKIHRVPGLDLSKTENGKFIFYCENSKAEFKIKNDYYGDKFHCPKCKNFHIAKPKGEIDDVSKLEPDIKPMEIMEEDPRTISKKDREARKRDPLKAKSTNSRLKKRTTVNSKIKKGTTVDSKFISGSGTVLMSVENENEMLNQIIDEQQYLYENQTKKSYKTPILIGTLLIPIIFGIIFILDKQNHDRIRFNSQQAQANILKMEFKKAIFHSEQAIQNQASKLLFFKNYNVEKLKLNIDNYKKMQSVYIKYEKEANPLLLSSTKIYDLHNYHEKIDVELKSFKEGDLIYKYLLDIKLKILTKEKKLIENNFKEQLAKANTLYKKGQLQSAIDFNSLTYKSWKLLGHKEFHSLNTQILKSKMFFGYRKKIIADIARVEDLRETMGTLQDSLDSLNEADRLADSIISRLNTSDKPLRKKIEKLKKENLIKSEKIRKAINESPEARRENERIAKEFTAYTKIIEQALKELDGKVITKSFANRVSLSSKNYSFSIRPMHKTNGYLFQKEDYHILYGKILLKYFTKLAILHFSAIEKTLTKNKEEEPNPLLTRDYIFKLPHVDALQGLHSLVIDKKGLHLLINGKIFNLQPNDILEKQKANLSQLSKLLLEINTQLNNINTNDPLWPLVLKTMELNKKQGVSKELLKITISTLLNGYFEKAFSFFPDKTKDTIKEFNTLAKKIEDDNSIDIIYKAEDGSIIRIKNVFFKRYRFTIYDKSKDTTTVYSRPYFGYVNNSRNSAEINLTFSAVYKGNVMDQLKDKKPYQLNTSHPSSGIVASYNMDSKKLTSDLNLFNKAILSGYSNVLENNREINKNLKPFTLSLNNNQEVTSIITAYGRLPFPDFTRIKDKKKELAEKNSWISNAAKVLIHPRELFLLYRYFFLSENSSALNTAPFLKRLLQITRAKNQNLSQLFDRHFSGRILGSEQDLAELYLKITRRQNRFSHIVSTLRGPVCCWIDKVDTDEYVLHILRTNMPLKYKGASLNEVLSKAFSQYSTGLVPFNPNEINIIIPLPNSKGSQVFRVDSKMLMDKKLYLKFVKEKITSIK